MVRQRVDEEVEDGAAHRERVDDRRVDRHVPEGGREGLRWIVRATRPYAYDAARRADLVDRLRRMFATNACVATLTALIEPSTSRPASTAQRPTVGAAAYRTPAAMPHVRLARKTSRYGRRSTHSPNAPIESTRAAANPEMHSP